MRTPITRADLAPLVDQYGMSWHIWPSAQGWYACATRRRNAGVPRPRTPQDPDQRDPDQRDPDQRDPDQGSTHQRGTEARPSPTLVEDSVAELADALARETRLDRAPTARDTAKPA